MKKKTALILCAVVFTVGFYQISLFATAFNGDEGPRETAQVLSVPGDYPTIQACIDGAAPGDTCLAAPGVYAENISFGGKAVTVASESGPEVTVIDGSGSGTVVVSRYSR